MGGIEECGFWFAEVEVCLRFVNGTLAREILRKARPDSAPPPTCPKLAQPRSSPIDLSRYPRLKDHNVEPSREATEAEGEESTYYPTSERVRANLTCTLPPVPLCSVFLPT